MKPAFEDMSLQIPAATAEPEDYTGEDGLLYCGKCRTPKEAYFPADKVALFGRDRHPAECDCQRAQRMEREAAEQQRKHRDKVEELKRLGFTDPAMREWTFANDNGRNPQMKTAHFYVEHWEDMKAGNIGYLLWGSVGTGKSYLAGCIANALISVILNIFGIVALTTITLFLSAQMSSPVTALITSCVICFLPVVFDFNDSLPVLQKMQEICPIFMLHTNGIFSDMKTYFGMSQPVFMIILNVGLIFVFYRLTKNISKKHQVTG